MSTELLATSAASFKYWGSNSPFFCLLLFSLGNILKKILPSAQELDEHQEEKSLGEVREFL